MAKTTKLIKSVVGLVLPVLVLVFLAVVSASVWFVHSTAEAPKSAYLVTPEEYGRLSSRGARVTSEKWSNRDGTMARGWLLRGTPGSPAVVLLHKYGGDRSHVLNLGVKINEATDFTILMPDLRGHGIEPYVRTTSFGACEADDTLAAIDYLKGLKTSDKKKLIMNSIGIHGVQLGGIAGLSAAARQTSIKALTLDSIPRSSEHLLKLAVTEKHPFASSVTGQLAGTGASLYFARGCYETKPVCDIASQVEGKEILLLAGTNRPALRTSTSEVSGCFPRNSRVTTFTDLSPSGMDLPSAPLEQADAYEERVIFFLKAALESQEEGDDESDNEENSKEAEEKKKVE